MFSRTAILLALLLLPLNAVAQPGVVVADEQARGSDSLLLEQLLARELSTPSAGHGAQVVPIWASPDGRLLTIVARSRDSEAPVLPLSPTFGGDADFRVIDATGLFSTGLRWRPGSGLRADVLVGQTSMGSNSLGLGALGHSPVQRLLSGTVGVGWSAADNSTDFSLGMSWLQNQWSTARAWMPDATEISTSALASMPIVGSLPFQLDSATQLNARGTWKLEHGPTFDITADITKAGLAPVWYGVPSANGGMEYGALGLGVSQGAVRGSLVGHVMRLDNPALLGSKRWSGIDLGVSWRTPWHGELSVGAQNLWSTPVDTNPVRETDPVQSRMPYVQYRQDL